MSFKTIILHILKKPTQMFLDRKRKISYVIYQTEGTVLFRFGELVAQFVTCYKLDKIIIDLSIRNIASVYKFCYNISVHC
ncbi:ORF1104 [White spot syndrome virus]|uniref:Wsv183 n=3 Tax=White spot syndrome virus TaxID=342409 RepID=Q8VB20_WSSVS|nr:wsv183 [Shrimp white spot syndrome virus]AFX59560.1 wsv183 [White spot syndrome virus]AAL33187.1 wsv183 [Shrimp white spot syndrome virus]AAL89107.1 WSSV239 [Shrimp white spot syndrome virus]ATU83853.1 ORF1104 [White spot syndrome virus]AWQ60359.1 wsv183 [Shrimp white spot syndrome virus]